MNRPKLLSVLNDTTKDTAYSRLNNPVEVSKLNNTTLTVNSSITVQDGAVLTFKAPCDCSNIRKIRVNEIDYTLLDFSGNTLTAGAFKSGALVNINVDTVNRKAYLSASASSQSSGGVPSTIANRLINLESAVSPLLAVDTIDDTLAIFKQIPENVLPYAYLNRLGDNCNVFNFGANLIDFSSTFSADGEGRLSTNIDDAYLMSDGRVRITSMSVGEDNREIHIAANSQVTTETFIYPPSTYSSLRRVIIPNPYGSNDTSATATTYFVAYGLMNNSLINIEEDTYIAEPFIIKEFVVKLEYYAHDSYDIDTILDTNLSFGSKVRDYTSYTSPTSFIVPDEIKSIEGYGNIGNYIDFDKKVYVRTSHRDEVDISEHLSEDNMIRVESGGIILFQPLAWNRPGLNIEVINEIMNWASNPYTSTITYKKEIFPYGLTSIGTGWDDVAAVVRSGLGKFIFPAGYEFTMKDQITGNDLVWVVRGHDNHKAVDSKLNHTMTLELKDVYSTASGIYQPIQFDGVEALYYAEEELKAGTYHFTVVDHLHETDNGKTFQFTLNESAPAGSHLCVSIPYPEATLSNAELIVYCNRGDGTSICSHFLLEESPVHDRAVLLKGQNGGTYLGTTGQGNFNHIQRATRGSNNYAQSAVRQWLNGEGTNFWRPQTRFDIAPAWDGSVSGLISSLPEEFLNLVQEAEIPCYTNSIYETNSLDGTEYGLEMNYTVKDKFFILSTPEVYSGYREENLKDYMYDGDALDFYDGLPHSERIKYDLAGRPRDVRERSTTIQTVTHTKIITMSTGNGSGTVVSHTRIGVTPACIIA